MTDNDLGKRIAAAQEARKSSDAGASGRISGKGMGIGFRMATEFVVAILVGAGLGWVLDSVLGTTPWMLIVWMLFGFAAGVSNVIRVAQASQVSKDDNAGSEDEG